MNEYTLLWRIQKAFHEYEARMGRTPTHIAIDTDLADSLLPETFTVLDEIRGKREKIAGLDVIRCYGSKGFMVGRFEEVEQ